MQCAIHLLVGQSLLSKKRQCFLHNDMENGDLLLLERRARITIDELIEDLDD